MASPQKENGFTPIANEILEALARVNLSPYEWRVLMFLFRKTYGHQKKADAIPLSQFSKGLCLDRRLVHRANKSLESKRLLVISRDDSGAVTYQFQKDYTKWRVSSRKMTVISRDDKTSSAEMTEVSSPEIPSKEIRKEKRKRVRGKPSPSNGSDLETKRIPGYAETVELFFDLFKAKFGTKPDFSAKDGKILSGLLLSHGAEKVCGCLRIFFKSPPDWIDRKGAFTIQGFKVCFTDLTVRWSRQSQSQSERRPLPL